MPRAHRKDFIRSATTTLSPRRSSSRICRVHSQPRLLARLFVSLCLSVSLSLSVSPSPPLRIAFPVQPEAPQQIRVVLSHSPSKSPRAISRVGAPRLQRVAVARRRVAENDAGPNADAEAALPAAPAPDGAPHVVPELPPPSKLSPRPPPKRPCSPGALPAPIPVSATVLIPVPATVPIPIPGDDLPPPPPPPPPPWYGARG